MAEALAAPLAALPRLFPIAVLYGLLMLVGLLALIFPALFLAAVLLPLFPVLAIEDVDPFSALSRSWSLGEEHRGRALGLVLCVSLLGIPVLIIDAALSDFSTVFSAVVVSLAYAAVGALGDAATFLFYTDLRCRKEAFDLEELAAEVDRGEADAP